MTGTGPRLPQPPARPLTPPVGMAGPGTAASPSPATVTPTPMVRRFPPVGARLRLAIRELHIAATGTADQVKALGDLSALPRPWDPPTCSNPELREELWAWLDDVVTWLNTEYTWDAAGVVPSCWPRHPHLVHDLAVLADQRRRAGAALTSDPLEEWHRYALPGFLDRARTRLREHCDNGHDSWPGTGRHARHTSQGARDTRAGAYAQDLAVTTTPTQRRGTPHLAIVDLTTGSIDDNAH